MMRLVATLALGALGAFPGLVRLEDRGQHLGPGRQSRLGLVRVEADVRRYLDRSYCRRWRGGIGAFAVAAVW